MSCFGAESCPPADADNALLRQGPSTCIGVTKASSSSIDSIVEPPNLAAIASIGLQRSRDGGDTSLDMSNSFSGKACANPLDLESFSDLPTVCNSETLESLGLLSRQTTVMSRQATDFCNDFCSLHPPCAKMPPRQRTEMPSQKSWPLPSQQWSRQRTDFPSYRILDEDGLLSQAQSWGGSSMPDVFNFRRDEIEHTVAVVNESEFKAMIEDVVAECDFSVTVADPNVPDTPLIAVSQAFELMSGFSRSEILGQNCRFLNHGCDLDMETAAALRHASQSGVPYTAVLKNRRKSGEIFLNLLDLRGLTVARNQNTGKGLWFLIGIQADVTNMATHRVPENHLAQLNRVAKGIRRRLTDKFAAMALSGALGASWASGTHIDVVEDGGETGETWRTLPSPKWKPSPDPEVYTLTSLPLVCRDESKDNSADVASLESLPELPNINFGSRGLSFQASTEEEITQQPVLPRVHRVSGVDSPNPSDAGVFECRKLPNLWFVRVPLFAGSIAVVLALVTMRNRSHR